MDRKSSLEKVSGNFAVTGSLTALSALLGGPAPALLPVLTSTLTNGRHRKRVEGAINDINQRLIRIENIDSSLTDAQYKLINEIVLSIFNTPDDSKIEQLKKALYNTPYDQTLTLHEATVLSRVLNQASVGELAFLVACFGQDILFGKHKHEGFMNIDQDSFDGECALGLISLGLISRSPAEGDSSDIGAYHFTSLAKKTYDILSN